MAGGDGDELVVEARGWKQMAEMARPNGACTTLRRNMYSVVVVPS